MASLNKVILIGNLGADPETRYLPDGTCVANIRIATSETWKDKATGEKKEATEWHRVAFFGRLGEIAGEYLRKGSQVYIEGKLQTRKWQDKDGQDRYSTEIRGDEMKMLGRKGDGGDSGDGAGYDQRPQGESRPAQQSQSRPAQQPQPRPAPATSGYSGGSGGGSRGGFNDFDDDIPFHQHIRGMATYCI